MDENISVMFLTRYDKKGASSRYRSLQFLPYLRGKGIRCEYEPLFSNSYLKTLYSEGARPIKGVVLSYINRLWSIIKSFKYDVLVIEKELFPYLPASFERLIGSLDIPYVVDYDDAIFHNYDKSNNVIVTYLLSEKIKRVMQSSNTVVAGNRYIAKYAREAGVEDIKIIPTVIDTDKYTYSPPKKKDPFIIGWIGTPDTIEFFRPILEPIKKVCRRIDAKVKFVGSGNIEFRGFPYEVVEWSSETEVEEIAKFDVGVMPLNDTPWKKGKCGFKLIQYMGCGKPVVASPVGANKDIVDHGINGYLAESKSEWVDSLMRIYNVVDRRKAFGCRARKKVENKYSLKKAVGEWLEVIGNIGSGN